MDVIVLFVPFIVAFGMYCANDPLSQRFWEDLTGDDHARRYKANHR